MLALAVAAPVQELWFGASGTSDMLPSTVWLPRLGCGGVVVSPHQPSARPRGMAPARTAAIARHSSVTSTTTEPCVSIAVTLINDAPLEGFPTARAWLLARLTSRATQ